MTTLKNDLVAKYSFIRTAIILLLVLSACASPKRIQKSDPVEMKSQQELAIEALRNSDFAQLTTAFQSGKYSVAIKKALQLEKKLKPQQSAIKTLTYLIHGKALNLTNDRPQAIKTLKKGLSSHSPLKAFIQIEIASCYLQNSNFDESLQVLSDVRPNQILELPQELQFLGSDPQVYQKKYYQLRSQVFLGMGLPVEAVRELIALSYFDLTSPQVELRTTIEKAMRGIENLGTLELLVKESEDSSVQDVFLYKLATNELAQGLPEQAKKHFEWLQRSFPKSQYIPLIPQFSGNQSIVQNTNGSPKIAVIDSSPFEETTSRSKTIGVVLPLSGKYSKFGQRTLQAILLATKLFEKNNSQPSDLKIVVEDSGSEPIETIHAINRLYYEHQVIAVIGPLLSKGIDLVAKRAAELKLPILSLAQLSPSEENPYFLSSGITPAVQNFNLAKYIFEELQIKKMAIVYPQNSKSGENNAFDFWDRFESLGGEITAVQSYSPYETDFRITIEKLSGLYFQDARKEEWDALAESRTTQGITKRTRKTESFFTLPPVVNFEGVYIAEGARIASQIIPTFSYRDVDSVKFFGPNSWNNDEFLVRLPKNMKYEIYLSDYLIPTNASEAIQTLAAQYRELTDQELTNTEMNAIDTVNFISNLFQKNTFSDRDNFLQILTTHNMKFNAPFTQLNVQGSQILKYTPILELHHGKFVTKN